MTPDTSEELPPLVELGPPGHYRTPPAIQALGVVMPSYKAPAQIRLALESGHELDIPVTQDTIDALYRSLRSMTTRP